MIRYVAALAIALFAFVGPASGAQCPNGTGPKPECLINASPKGADDMTVSQRIKSGGSALGLSASGYTQFLNKNSYSSFSYFPATEGYSFDIYSARVSAGIELGCDGLSIDSLVDSLKGQFEYIIEYYKQNALGLAINYLIYSRPTLAALIDKLKAAFEINLNHALITCAEARAAGEAKAKKKMENPEGAAWTKCKEKNPGNSGACLGDASPFGKSLNDVFTEAGNSISSTMERFGVSPKLLKPSDMAGPIACSGMSEADMEIAYALLPQKQPDSKAPGGAQNAGQTPQVTIEALVISRSKYLVSKYDYIVRTYNDDNWDTSSEFRELVEFSGEVKFSGSDFKNLKVLHSRSRTDYSVAINDLAAANAVATVGDLVDRIRSSTQLCQQALPDKYPFDTRERLMAALDGLETEVKRLRDKLEAKRPAYEALLRAQPR